MMKNDAEQWVHEYVVALYLLKALHVDRKNMESTKFSTIWFEFLTELFDLVERDVIRKKNQLRNKGCRIVLEEVTENHKVHVMYVYKGYEQHSVIMPSVLKGRCEEKLKNLIHEERLMK